MVRATLTTMDAPPDHNSFEQSPYPSFNITTDHPDATITLPTQYDDPDNIPPEDIVRGDLSSAEYFPSSQGSLSLSQTTPLVPVPPHYTDSSTLGPSLSMANLTETMRPNELAPTILITEMEETSQTPAATLSTFSYSERGATTPPRSTVSRPSSVPATQPGHFPYTSPSVSSALTLSRLRHQRSAGYSHATRRGTRRSNLVNS